MKIEKEDAAAYGIYAIIALVVLTLALAGCATFNRIVTNNELTVQLATEAATARVIHEHPSWKAQTVSIIGDAIGLIDSSALVQLDSVEAYVKDHIPWNKLMPEEQALVSILITQVRKNIEDTFRARAVTDPLQQMVEVRKVLGWINDAARRQP